MTTYLTIRSFTFLIVFVVLFFAGLAGFAVGKAHFRQMVSNTNAFLLMLAIPLVALILFAILL